MIQKNTTGTFSSIAVQIVAMKVMFGRSSANTTIEFLTITQLDSR